jgi:hypothetical protein
LYTAPILALRAELEASLRAMERSFYVELIGTFGEELVCAPASANASAWLQENGEDFDQFPVKRDEETIGIGHVEECLGALNLFVRVANVLFQSLTQKVEHLFLAFQGQIHRFDRNSSSERKARNQAALFPVAHEIVELADECTVFRNGRNVATYKAGTKTDNEVVEMMIGREYSHVFPSKPPAPSGGRKAVSSARPPLPRSMHDVSHAHSLEVSDARPHRSRRACGGESPHATSITRALAQKKMLQPPPDGLSAHSLCSEAGIPDQPQRVRTVRKDIIGWSMGTARREKLLPS